MPLVSYYWYDSKRITVIVTMAIEKIIRKRTVDPTVRTVVPIDAADYSTRANHESQDSKMLLAASSLSGRIYSTYEYYYLFVVNYCTVGLCIFYTQLVVTSAFHTHNTVHAEIISHTVLRLQPTQYRIT